MCVHGRRDEKDDMGKIPVVCRNKQSIPVLGEERLTKLQQNSISFVVGALRRLWESSTVQIVILVEAQMICSCDDRRARYWYSVRVNLDHTKGIVVDSGPLVPGGPLTYVLYLLTAVWLPVATTLLVVRLGKPRQPGLDLRSALAR